MKESLGNITSSLLILGMVLTAGDASGDSSAATNETHEKIIQSKRPANSDQDISEIKERNLDFENLIRGTLENISPDEHGIPHLKRPKLDLMLVHKKLSSCLEKTDIQHEFKGLKTFTVRIHLTEHGFLKRMPDLLEIDNAEISPTFDSQKTAQILEKTNTMLQKCAPFDFPKDYYEEWSSLNVNYILDERYGPKRQKRTER